MDEILKCNHERLTAIARVIAQHRRQTEGHDVRSPSKEDYRVAEPVLAAINSVSPPIPRPKNPPSFDHIQEAIIRVRKGRFLPCDLVDEVILPALRHFCDICHPETAE